MRSSQVGRLIGGFLLLLAVFLLSVANAPAPYWACSGKSAGDQCEPYGSTSGCFHDDSEGRCQLYEGCTDNPETDVNECLNCVD
jgi:hypothetical protein